MGADPEGNREKERDLLERQLGLGECVEAKGDCQDALQDLERYLDGELPETQLSSIRGHLAACYPCSDRASFEEQLRAIIRERCVEQTPPDLHDAIRQRLDGIASTP